MVADLTDASSVIHELTATVPHLRQTAVVPICEQGSRPPSMFYNYQKYDWVLDVHYYEGQNSLVVDLERLVQASDAVALRLQREALEAREAELKELERSAREAARRGSSGRGGSS